MKRVLACAVLLALGAAGAAADRLLFIGPGFSYGTESREALPDWSMTSIDFHMATFSGKSFGLYSNVSMGWILSSRTGGVPIDVSLYDMRFSLDSVVGFGYRLPVKRIVAIVGAGLYLGIGMMLPTDYMDPSYGGGMTVGPGIQATVTYPVRRGLLVGASLGAGYSISELMPLEDPNFRSGLHVFAGVGVAL
jgi:hypothetical protein